MQQVVPFGVSVVAAALVTPGILRTLRDGGHTVTNYRGVAIPSPIGLAMAVAIALALGALGVLVAAGLSDGYAVLSAAFVLGVATLGMADDAYSGPSRGWRGHATALLRGGGLPTGALKALGTLGLAAFVAARGGEPALGRFILEVLVLVLSTNLFNILDLRPGRSAKAFVALAVGLLVLADAHLFEAVGVYVGAILVAGVFDLREAGMLGDTGSNLIGAVAGLWLVAALSTLGLAVAAAVLAAITAYGEFRSINALVERTPPLRFLDSLGRAHRA